MIRALIRELTTPRPLVLGEPHVSCRALGAIDAQLLRTHPGLARVDAAEFARGELEVLLRNHECYTHQSARTTTGRAAPAMPYYTTLRSKEQMAKTRVFKLQRPIETNDPEPKVLAYDQHRRFEFRLPLTAELERIFGDAYKVFVNATPRQNQLVIGEPVRARDW